MTSNPGNPWPALQSDGPLLAPSLLACNFARVGEQIDQALACGVRVLHVDIMDGHFVPNLSMGPGFCKSIRQHTRAGLDVHLMLTDPAEYIERFAEAGADSITFHIEATPHPGRLIERLRELGLGAAVTVKPGTDPACLWEVIEQVDMVLVMTVEPGYGGQAFMDEMLDKVQAIRARLRDDQRLQVDGGINADTIGRCRHSGADTFVAGSSIFKADDISQAIAELRDALNSTSIRG
jgi:ribulose-phosphate 3-epimerase